MPHPLHAWLRAQDSPIEKSCEKLAKACARRGAPVSPRMLKAIGYGERPVRPPLSTALAKITGIDELGLIKASARKRVA